MIFLELCFLIFEPIVFCQKHRYIFRLKYSSDLISIYLSCLEIVPMTFILFQLYLNNCDPDDPIQKWFGVTYSELSRSSEIDVRGLWFKMPATMLFLVGEML